MIARQTLRVGVIVGICIGALGIFCLAAVVLRSCRSMRRTSFQMSRSASSEDLKDEVFEMKEEVPKTRLWRVFSKIVPRRRKQGGQEFYELSRESSYLGRSSSSRGPTLHAPHAELDSNGLSAVGTTKYQGNRGNRGPDGSNPYQRALRKMERETKSAHDISPQAHHHRPQQPSPPASAPSSDVNCNSLPSMPSLAKPCFSKRQSRRFDLPSPLIIAPPQTSASLVKGSKNATSTFISYSSHENHTPHTVSPLPTDDVGPASRLEPRSLHSSSSNHSSRTSGSPVSLSSRGPVSSLSRSNSAVEQMEARPLPPPSPTYHQSQRAPIDSENIICLGPMPNHIPLPSSSNNHFRSQPQNPRSPPRLVIPCEQHSPPPSLSSPSSPVLQDLFLHDQSPLAPYQSPVKSVFTRELSLHSHGHGGADSYHEGERRGSTDSLGSNFTVEEEARIQAQIVRNLSMLGHERVGGEGDIVHVPQPPPRRYSWEEPL